jgi:hypothetical protein
MILHINVFNIASKVLLCLSIFFISCKGNNSPKSKRIKNTPPFHVDLNQDPNNFRKVPLSEVADSIQYIALETSEECFFSSARKIVLTPDFIFIHDFDGLFKFDRKGKFICKIGSKGNGPGEYKNIRTFTADPDKELLFVIFHWKHMIAIYNFDGEYIKSIKFSPYAEQIELFNNECLALSGPCSGAKNHKFNLYLLNYSTGKIIKKYDDYYNIKGRHSIKLGTLVSFNNGLYFNDHLCDTLFRVNDEMKQIPYCIFEHSKFKVLDTSSFPCKVSGVQRIYPGNDYVYFIFNSPLVDMYGRSGIYDIKSGNFCYISPSEETYRGSIGFYNDFDGLLHFWPRFYGANGEMIYYYNMCDLKDIREFNAKCKIPEAVNVDSTKYKEIDNMISKRKIADNGVVVIAYQK